MRWTVERLRISLVVVALGLVLLLVAAFFYTRWQVHRIARDLPARLGIQIQQSTEGFTYSKTEQGRTVFTLHAARAIQYRAGGHAILHDVRIQVFNPKDGLADTITGSQFEYDSLAGIVRSVDEARIDLHVPPDASSSQPLSSPLKKPLGALNTQTKQAQPDRMIQVVTHGLLFSTKTSTATTDGLLEFRLPQGSGQAVGAVYNTKQGQLLLKSKVEIHAQTQNGAATIHAAQALYTQQGNRIHMDDASYSTAKESASARMVTLLLRSDGSAENINAQQDVRYHTANGQSISAHAMIAALDNRSRPQAAHFYGKILFQLQQPNQSTQGSAGDGQFFFTKQGQLRQAVLDQNVKFQQTGSVLSHRNLQANHLVVNFVPGADGRPELQLATATGDAIVHEKSLARQQSANLTHPGNAQSKDNTITAQQLVARFSHGNQLVRLEGKGNTQLQSITANGDVDTSTGDTLLALFSPSNPKARKKVSTTDSFSASDESIEEAVQQGHVVLRQIAVPRSARQTNFQTPTKPSAQQETSTITAAKAEYQGVSQVFRLTGNPQFQDSQLQMSAQQMQVNRASGVMTATGAVQTTLLHASRGHSAMPSGDSTHIIADQAQFNRPEQQAIFTGHARLWQAESVIEAPVIKILQRQQSLQAYGNQQDAVRCTFVSSQAAGATAKQQPVPVDVTSEQLLYSNAEQKAHFTGNVRVTMQGSQLQAQSADIFFEPSSSRMVVDRMVVDDNVKLVQPGRYGTGAKIVYTASDGRFQLTGTEQTPPRIVDAVKGSVSGRTLIFSSQQNAVRVEGGNTATTTEMQVQK